ncbi:MAG: acyclic terpene utilization AtuA family protein [Pararhodobacter sp.]
MSGKVVRIGGASAAWGDTVLGAGQLVRQGAVDYLVGDYLAEVTMAILARMRAKDPQAGFIPDWLASVKPHLSEIKRQGIRLVTNAGGMNPAALRDAFQAAAAEAGLAFRVAVITGDDLSAQQDALRAAAPREMFTGAALPARLASCNAYLGARPIAAALAEGAEVVITGRCVDSALVLGPLMHEFGWGPDDHDLLAAGSLAGHVIECGAQATGGLFTDWRAVADGWDDMGFPVIECAADGSFVVTKPEGTGGMVTPATVAEQIVYEIGDPQTYHLPDVICDFADVRLEQAGPDRVLVRGARGRAPGPDYKVCATWADGFRLMTTYLIAGFEAAGKGRATAQALVRRTQRIMAARGMADYREVSIEVIGAEDTWGAQARDDLRDGAREVVVKIGLRHDDPKALEVFAREFAHPGVSMAQGLTGVLHGRPKPAPMVRVFSFLWPKAQVAVAADLDGRAIEVPDVPAAASSDAPALPPMPGYTLPPGDTATVPLRALAWGRSGDKGDDANIGLIARRAEYFPLLCAQMTDDRVAAFFAHYLQGGVTRYALPGFHALNFHLRAVLGGGGSASLRYDPQAKTYAQMLLDLPVTVPASWVAPGGMLVRPEVPAGQD